MILYEGPSELNGEPIVVIAVEDGNPKIGKMLCTYILMQDVAPRTAVDERRDEAICGECPLRQQVVGDATTRGCYVRLGADADETWSPEDLWRSYKDGNPAWNDDAWGGEDCRRYMGGLSVRLGSYGDPAAAPFWVWDALLYNAKHWTGYTHQWRTCDPRLQEYCMASVDSPEEKDEAQARGWRTYHVVPYTAQDYYAHNHPEEILCPASYLAGQKTTCAKCSLCKGQLSNSSKSIWVPAHGKNKDVVTWT